jgi:diguanylate cyclase (GGDEF)-like protein
MATPPIKVLLVEDNPVDARLVAGGLEGDRGFELIHVERLCEAVGRLEEEPVDVVLLDLMLPDARGLGALLRLCERTADLAVVVLTGFGAEDLDLALEAVRAGAQDFLHKGAVDAPSLCRALRIAVERKRLEAHRIRYARHDPLTGLGNGALLAERFERALARMERSGRHGALLALGLDRFRDLIESHGSDRADLVVKAAAARLGRQLRRTDTLARLRPGGFALLAEDLSRPADAVALGERLLRILAEPLTVDGVTVELGGSIGIAPVSRHAGLEALLGLAEEAALGAMREGGNRVRVRDPAQVPPVPGAAALIPEAAAAHAVS